MPTWKELKRFCENDGWDLYKKTDHFFFRKIDEKGNTRKTKVSNGSGEIGHTLWREILRKQLCITQEEFNQKI